LSELAENLAKAGKADDERDVRAELVQAYLDAKEWKQAQTALAPLLDSADEAVRTQGLLLQADALVGEDRHADALAALAKGSAPQSSPGAPAAPSSPAAPPSPPSPILQSRRAEVLLRSGDEREGRRLLAALAEGSEPQSPLAAAQAYQRLERFPDSIPILERLVAKQKDSVVAGFLLGVAYERTEQRGKAVTEFRRILELDPEFHAALNYLGYTYAESGENLEEALALVRRAVALEPDNGSYVDSLGWTYYRLGRHEQARSFLERAVRLEPADATLQEHLGDVYVALGQTERAREAYRRALELEESDAEHAEQVRRKLDDLSGGVPRP
jgi:tetratricopeptide (TPR) repeat protein